ncbi:DUF1569 domain-containing protein [Sphingobacterium hungaricum]
MAIDVNNKDLLNEKLAGLHADTAPNFGRMTAQHMLEHLSATVLFSNGKLKAKLYIPEEKAESMKQYLVYTDNEFPMGIKAPMLNDELPPLRFPDLETVKERLILELERFKFFFDENPDAKTMHPTLGELTYDEWKIVHDKHFAHHFKQFGL